MEIGNRYGKKLYSYRHNGDRYKEPIWWDGTTDAGVSLSSGIVPSGTYFYTIYFNDGKTEPIAGWLYLRE
jgi:DUF971 family protein